MFVYSVRASTIKFFLVIVLTLSLLIGVLVLSDAGEISVSAASQTVDFDGIKTNEQRVKFIESFGISVSDEPREQVSFSVPENFDTIISGYNEIQKLQGLDLTRYKNKKVTRYTYNVEKYEEYDGEVVVNIIVYRGNVIGCDVSSLSPGGFVKPLVNLD